ncbi:MAG: helix-turn-helix domain-containing protein [Geminicoccaceae bacterium]
MPTTETVIIRDPKGRRTHVVVPIAEWRRLRERAEAVELAELRTHDTIPDEHAGRILDGERPLKVFREWRGLSQAELGRRAGLPQPTIAQLESGKRKGTVAQIRKLAKALGLQLETLVGWKADETTSP